MSAILEQFLPSMPGAGAIGSPDFQWGAGHFASLFVAGAEVATLSSPEFTDEPKAPTPDASDSSTRIATTAFVRSLIAEAVKRANHEGTQTAATISDFAEAVAESVVGQKVHDKNKDAALAEGSEDEVSAAELRAHLDNSDLHFAIDDISTSSSSVWSSLRVSDTISSAVSSLGESIGEELGNLGALAQKDSIGTDDVGDGAITGAKVAGGSNSPGVAKYWGTDQSGTFGFHSIIPALKTVPAAGEGAIGSDSNGIFVLLGTAENRAAAGNDSRFPTSQQKDALAGASGSPSSTNRFLTEQWAQGAALGDEDIEAGESETAGLVSPAQLKLAAQTFGGGGGAAGKSWFLERQLVSSGPVSEGVMVLWVAPVAGWLRRFTGYVAQGGSGPTTAILMKNGTQVIGSGTTILHINTLGGWGLWLYGVLEYQDNPTAHLEPGDVLSVVWGDGSGGSDGTPATSPFVIGWEFLPDPEE